jgi:hypothetical protein
MNAFRYLVLYVLLLQAGICFAQKKIPVEVAHAGNDSVGYTVAEELRAAIRAAQGALVMPQALEASDYPAGLRLTMELGRPRIRLQLVGANTVPPGSETPIAVNIVYDSADVPLGGAYIRTVVEMCGINNASSCAARILAATNRCVEWLRENWPSLWKTL